MAFKATYNLPISLTQAMAVPIPDAYFKIDGSAGFGGGKDAGQWFATVRVYANQAARVADLGDFINDAEFTVSTPYVANVDPYPALYTAAKVGFSDAVDVI